MTFLYTEELASHFMMWHTVNDRLNALGVYLKIQNFKGVFNRGAFFFN